jgi:hypothetical protein
LNEKQFIDRYLDNRKPGQTINSKSPEGFLRKGIDKEKLIAIDNGALRFQPLFNHGWGKQGIAYGSYQRTNGLAFATFILNGHNTSQAESIETLLMRLLAWVRGNKVIPFPLRILRWLFWKHNQKFLRRLLWWIRLSPKIVKKFPLQPMNENLAVGWFPNEIPINPLQEGNAFIVHATGPNNGELWTRVKEDILSTFKNLQNLQVYYIVILREKGAAYYVAGVSNAYGLGTYPYMRPVAIDPVNDEPQVYAGIYQSTLGQIGFRVDTRVYGSAIATIPELANWYGTAQIADSFQGEGLLLNRTAEIGGNWNVVKGCYQLTDFGAIATENNTLALLDRDCANGLIHTILETSGEITPVYIIWRARDENNCWLLILSSDRTELQIRENGFSEIIAKSDRSDLKSDRIHSLQILDDGEEFSLYLDSKLIFERRFADSRLADANGIGIGAFIANKYQYLRCLEAHPRRVNIPTQLDLGSPWCKKGKQILVADDFVGEPGHLEGRNTTVGKKIWRKDLGKGKFALTGDGKVRVIDAKIKPYPGRTSYTVDWDNSNFADVRVDITPPGTERNQRERSRAGLIFWQDSKNYFIVNIWLNDNYKSAALSSFFHLDGGEEIFDGAWTNLGDRVTWGITYNFRVAFDGMHYTAFINNEPVFYRALTDIYPTVSSLNINRVGIVVNWEWGDDTGSSFEN